MRRVVCRVSGGLRIGRGLRRKPGLGRCLRVVVLWVVCLLVIASGHLCGCRRMLS